MAVSIVIYLDNAATSRKKPLSVYASMMKNTFFGSQNAGRGANKLSLAAVRTIVEAQDTIAELFNIDKPQNIAFMQNATYALNTAIRGTLRRGDHVIATEMDHNSVLRPIYEYDDYTIVKANSDGFVDAADVESAIKENTRLIVCTHASNVCGALQPIEEIGKIAKRHNVMFLVDTAQTAGSVEIDVDKIGADLLAFSGHKGLMGALGTGGLYVREPSLLTPIVTGGTGSNSESVKQPDFMPDMLHSGTMNTPAIAALREGVRYVIHHGAENIGAHERFLAAYFESELMNVKGIRIYGKKPKIGTVAFNMGNVDSVCIEKLLSDRFAVRAGFHCAPLAHKALGTSDRGAVRVSFGAFSRKYEVKMLIDALYKISKSELG
jgi:cysteine desulfurase family protein